MSNGGNSGMFSNVKPVHVAVAAGAVVAVGALAYYLFAEEKEESFHDAQKVTVSKEVLSSGASGKSGNDHIIEVLQEVLSSQTEMKSFMKELITDFAESCPPFEQAYDRVKTRAPKDPLMKFGMTMEEFDDMLTRHQSDPAVSSIIDQIMSSGATPGGSVSRKARETSVSTILKVHEYMHAELRAITSHFQDHVKDSASFDPKSVTIAAQAIVSAKVLEEFQLSPEDLEEAVMMHHEALSSNADFMRVNVQLQDTMGHLMALGEGTKEKGAPGGLSSFI